MRADQQHTWAVLASAQCLDHLAGELRTCGVCVHQDQVEARMQGFEGQGAFRRDHLDPGAFERLVGQCLQRGTENQNPLSRELGCDHGVALRSKGLANGLSSARPMRTSSARLGSVLASNGVGMSSSFSEGAMICGVTMIRSSL